MIYVDFVGQYKISSMRVVGMLSIYAIIAVDENLSSHTPNADEYLWTCARAFFVLTQTTQKLVDCVDEQKIVPLSYLPRYKISGFPKSVTMFLIGCQVNNTPLYRPEWSSTQPSRHASTYIFTEYWWLQEHRSVVASFEIIVSNHRELLAMVLMSLVTNH